jgi:spore coat polysaccharide biosynthesis protein SpsF (cytidylyltransferase family)
MSSRRLPGKVLAEIAGRPGLQLLLERLGGADEVEVICVATSEGPEDDPIAELAARLGVECVRGSLEDVLGRYRLAASRLDADAVVRVTGDCPLLDPAVVDMDVRRWREDDVDYVSNLTDPPSFPIGQHAEVISRPVLDAVDSEATDPADREHVTLFVRRRSDRFELVTIEGRPGWGRLRMVLDTPDDLAQLQELGRRCGPEASLEELISALEDRSG